jgi:alkanesulfonate monooxygenase SsuD/methylene tetrahydromethanopterin reductase-like flavin-dependent oxidoreductase (luciferase family)
MNATAPVGVFIATATPPERIAAPAASAERAGFAEVWVAEDYFCHGGSGIPARFRPGIGHGLGAWTDQMNLTPRSPLSALRECVSGVRALLAGETVDVEGKQFTFRSVQLTPTRPRS